jgi:glycerophosphoryl diester phosphodiesterase
MRNIEESNRKAMIMQNNRRLKLFVIFILLLLILIGEQIYNERVIKKGETFDAFVLVEKNTMNFQSEWFEEQWGISTDFVEKRYYSTSRLIKVLEKKIKLYANATIVCMQVPPDIFEYSEFEEVLNANPSITFYTYCTVEPISFWQNLTTQEILDLEKKYNATSEMLNGYDNVVHFEFYNLEWIISNVENYQKKDSLNETVSLAVFHSFTDHLNTYEETSNFFSSGEISFENTYQDGLLGKQAIVFGDSIWDIDRTSTGVETVIEQLSGMEIENLSIGGSSAAFQEEAPENFTQKVNALILQEEKPNPDYIFIEFGLNDYFSQVMIENEVDAYDINTFKGALRTGIERLRNNFPQAEIILIGPTTIMLLDSGTIDIAGEGNLRDYEHALEDISKEYEISLITNYMIQELHKGNMEQYLRADQVHFNEKGMYVYAKRILAYLFNDNEKDRAKWYEEYFYIAHACGGIDDLSYTNSMEAFVYNYNLGHRVFEIDLALTADEELVAIHNWENQTIEEIFGVQRDFDKENMALTKNEFIELSEDQKYTPLLYEDVLDLLEEYPDAYIVLDTKESEEEIVQKQYDIIVKNAMKRDHIIERMIPQIYNEEMYDVIMNEYSWDTLIYTMYGLLEFEPEEVISFCEKENIDVVTTFPSRADKAFVEALKEQGVKIYMHTFNTREEVNEAIQLGADGIYTDFLY